MRMTLVPLVLPMVLALDGDALPKTFHLVLSGDDGVAFEGGCMLEDEAGASHLPLAGSVPQSLVITADAIDCSIRSDGRLTLDVHRARSRTRSSTDGGTITLRLR